MRKRKIIDISTEEKRREIFEKFNNFTSKNQAHLYFGISDNRQGSDYLKQIASEVGFDFDAYKTMDKKPTRYCKECGKEIISKWGKKFCCSSCAAKYNNKHRNKSVYEKVANVLKKDKVTKNRCCHIKNIFTKKCEYCGKDFETKNLMAKFCSYKCSKSAAKEEKYKDFIENNEKYCRGNYTPRRFLREKFLAEQGGLCAICGCKTEHNGKPLVFVLDHIDGDASNNKRENLRMICPNCDSQLDTFKSKNKNSTRRNYWKEHILNEMQGINVVKNPSPSARE